MRTIFTFAVALVIGSYAFADGELRSVVVNEPTPAPAVDSKDCGTKSELVCVNGRCGAQRLYSSNTCTNSSCRNRLFGGKVVRNNTRTVVRPVR